MLAVQGSEAGAGEREVIHGGHPLRDVPTLTLLIRSVNIDVFPTVGEAIMGTD
jgi:hypothetical protein